MADKVKTVDDLRSTPGIAAMFDKDGNGKGEYLGRRRRLQKSTRHVAGQVQELRLVRVGRGDPPRCHVQPGQLKAAINREKPILFYYWTPEWVHAAYDISAIEEPARTDGCENMDLDKEDWLEASHFACASTDAMIYVAYLGKSLEKGKAAENFDSS